ncbi:MAG: hypothetical protein ABIP10_03400 [Ferruginibacter sp.]
MPTIIARHKVGDINEWLKGQAERMELFAPVSSGFRAFRDLGDPNSVVIVIETEDIEKLAEMINDPKNDAIKAKHTVIEPVTISTEITF